MGLLRLPEPYDFELSTGRYCAFGPDLANHWVDVRGALAEIGDRDVPGVEQALGYEWAADS